jgi:phosphoglycerol geranylgeranyltransferase
MTGMKDSTTLYKKFGDGKKKFVPLVDPDKISAARLKMIAGYAEKAGVAFIFFGGSLVTKNKNHEFIRILKENCSIPVILFPGSQYQILDGADGILLLSLISGRNPDLLIGNHVIAAPVLKATGLDIFSTGYMLIDGGKPTAVSYMSNSTPIPHDKEDIACCTALAGEMLGMQLIYLDSGSGALHPVSASMIRKVRKSIKVPLIVGGGIKNPKQAQIAWNAGADIVVVGNAIEENPRLILDIAENQKKKKSGR